MRYLVLLLLCSFGVKAQTYEPADTIAMAPPTYTPTISLYVPEFISPNDDGINDVFDLNTDPNDRVELRVYSRWGNLVYSNDDYKNDYSPTNLSDGVYAFWIRIHIDNRYEDFQEMVTIIK